MSSRARSRRFLTLLVGLCLAAGCRPGPSEAQETETGASVSCTVPEAVRARVAQRPPAEEWYETRRVAGAEGNRVPLGVGHLHYSERNTRYDVPPGELDWLRSIDLPFSPEPGAAATGWITMGWIVEEGVEPVPLRRANQIETGYEEISLIVLEVREEWLRVRYADGAEDDGWVPGCALDAGSMLFDFTPWERWLTSGSISPLFFRADSPDDLFASPDPAAERRAIGPDYHLEPLEVRGSWMRVRLREPSNYCDFDRESDATEGWIRWYADHTGPTVWYFTRGC